MSFLDRIAECNNADLSDFKPFRVGQENVGWVSEAFMSVLSEFPDVALVEKSGTSLAPSLNTRQKQTRSVDAVLRDLAQAGDLTGWRDEAYAVSSSVGGPVLMEMERAAIPRFGLRASGVHLNGFVRKRDGIHMWVGRRSMTKSTYRGQLDNGLGTRRGGADVRQCDVVHRAAGRGTDHPQTSPDTHLGARIRLYESNRA